MRWLKKEEICEEGDYVMYPDASAEKRYSERLEMKYLLGIKHRDWATGKIIHYQAFNTTGEELNTKSNVFIVDDLCAKGTTAYNAGLALRDLGFKRIYLMVAHCEPSIFDGLLLNKESPLKTIYTSDSMIRPESGKIKVIE
jgi:ribose-phosphate pyrophosphokinase